MLLQVTNGKIIVTRAIAIGLLGLLLAVVSCDETPTESEDRDRSSPYMIESQLSLSCDRQYVYFIGNDTVFPESSGIYRARSSNPRRELLLAGQGYESPTISPNNEVVAYLKAGKIWYYRLNDDHNWRSDINTDFSSLLFVTDSLLVGGRLGFVYWFDSLFLVDESRTMVRYLTEGYDPTMLSPGRFIYNLRVEGQAVSVLENDTSGKAADTIYTVFEVGSPGWTRWPSLAPDGHRLVYVHATYGWKYLYSGERGVHGPNRVDSTAYDRAVMLTSNRIVYTGLNGRLYEADFTGELTFPYVATDR